MEGWERAVSALLRTRFGREACLPTNGDAGSSCSPAATRRAHCRRAPFGRTRTRTQIPGTVYPPGGDDAGGRRVHSNRRGAAATTLNTWLAVPDGIALKFEGVPDDRDFMVEASYVRDSLDTFAVRVLSSAAAIEQMYVTAVSLSGECEKTCNPRFYLASIDKDAWIPRVVTVTEAGASVGIVYAKERKFAGMATGLIYGDATLDTMVVAMPEHREPPWWLPCPSIGNRCSSSPFANS